MSNIISASRRTDIPAVYADWMAWRLREGYVTVVNPYNAKQSRQISLSIEDVDAIVYWSKNPAPLLAHPVELDAFPWLMQYTLNAYPESVEPGIPALDDRIACFRAFSLRHGPIRMNWRYDPIFLSEFIDMSFHIRAFEHLAAALEGYTHSCTISFIDPYAGMERRMSGLGYRHMEDAQIYELAGHLSALAKRHGMRMDACAEPYDLTAVSIEKGRCIDARRLSEITGRPIGARHDRNQRPHCGCDASVDIARYGTCTNGCAYCYAVRGNAGRRARADGAAL